MTLTFNTIQKSIVPILESSNVNYAGLFGSYARNEPRADSDVDLLVSFSKPVSLLTVCRVERNLSEVLQKKVDLVTKGALSPYIKPYVMKDLQTLYEKK